MTTLVRLSFFVPPTQLDDFASLYDRRLIPLLQSHGLEVGFSDDRPYVADGLGSPLIGALLWDRGGKLWVGTWEGLSCFDGAQFANYTETWPWRCIRTRRG